MEMFSRTDPENFQEKQRIHKGFRLFPNFRLFPKRLKTGPNFKPGNWKTWKDDSDVQFYSHG